MALLAFILVSTTVLWFSLVAVFLTQQKIRNLFLGKQKELNQLFGVILVVVGISIGLF
jgi:threonine/homoserine/homoserine lactone efflux protein